MKFKNSFQFLEALRDELGDDLVYSLSLDTGKAIVTISTHKSNRIYRHGRQTQSCQISPRDFKRDIKSLAEEIANTYIQLLVVEGESLSKGIKAALQGD